MKFRMIAATVAVAAAMVACSPSGSETPNPTPETPPPMTPRAMTPKQRATPTPSPTVIQSFPPAPADETEEQAAIREGWMNYWNVLDEFVKNPFTDDLSRTQLVTVSGSEQARVVLDEIQELRQKRWKVSGNHRFRNVVISDSVQVDDVLESQISYCFDGRDRHVVDVDSEDVLDVGAPATLNETAWLQEGDDGVWRVAQVRNEIEAC